TAIGDDKSGYFRAVQTLLDNYGIPARPFKPGAAKHLAQHLVGLFNSAGQYYAFASGKTVGFDNVTVGCTIFNQFERVFQRMGGPGSRVWDTVAGHKIGGKRFASLQFAGLTRRTKYRSPNLAQRVSHTGRYRSIW